MDLLRSQSYTHSSVYGLRLYIVNLIHMYQDMDLYISDWYMPNGLHIPNCWYIPVYNTVDFQ